MGERQSNPVLEILDPQQTFHENQKYPENKLTFNEGVWRAYYHRHAPPYKFENEHGHFHIFHKVNEDDWTHVAGLSMDNQGQVQKWFVTNRWVTDETWQDAEKYAVFFIDDPEENLLPVEQWLYAMVLLYQQELQQLLLKRDQEVRRLVKDTSVKSVKENRDVYILAEQDVDLQEKLTGVLVN